MTLTRWNSSLFDHNKLFDSYWRFSEAFVDSTVTLKAVVCGDVELLH